MVFSKSTSQTGKQRSVLCCRTLPLAVYREVVAHLRQVDGVEAGLVPQSSQEFDYALSQIGSMWIEYDGELDSTARDRIDRILAYYGDRYGAWETA